MSNLQASGELLNASLDDRTLTYLLLPFGSEGRTNIGKLRASKGSVNVPQDVATLPVNEEHDYKRPVGRFVSIEETDEGLIGTIRLAATRAGDDTLALAREGLRTGISVEMDQLVIRNGELKSGRLNGAAVCVKPAFADAQLIASDFGETEDDEETASEEEENPETESAEDTTESESTMENTTAAVPAALNASNGQSVLAPRTFNEAANLIATAYARKDVRLAASLEEAGIVGEEGLFAALANVTNTAHKNNVEQNQWLGELWSGKAYTRKYVNLVNTGSLTSWKVEGWRFLVKPEVGDYAGDLAEIPTNTPTTEYYSTEASRIAGGWKLDRKYRDFGNTEFISSFFKAATEDYARKSDKKVVSFISANSQAVTGTVVPTGVAPAAAKIVNGAMAMIDVATPTFAVVGTNAYREMLMTTEFDNLKFITQSLGLEGGNTAGFQVIPSSDIGINDVYVGAKEAITFFELPGTPIQVTALDVAKGGEDDALFGYYALVLNDARGLKKVS